MKNLCHSLKISLSKLSVPSHRRGLPNETVVLRRLQRFFSSYLNWVIPRISIIWLVELRWWVLQRVIHVESIILNKSMGRLLYNETQSIVFYSSLDQKTLSSVSRRVWMKSMILIGIWIQKVVLSLFSFID